VFLSRGVLVATRLVQLFKNLKSYGSLKAGYNYN